MDGVNSARHQAPPLTGPHGVPVHAVGVQARRVRQSLRPARDAGRQILLLGAIAGPSRLWVRGV
eukprot:397142-Lingulodinium_polyedra.AAC.1